MQRQGRRRRQRPAAGGSGGWRPELIGMTGDSVRGIYGFAGEERKMMASSWEEKRLWKGAALLRPYSLYQARFAIPNGTACTGRYVLVCYRPVRGSSATGWYCRLGLFSPRYCSLKGGISLATAREKEEVGEEKGELGDPTPPSLDDPDPLPPSLDGRQEVASSRSSPRLRRRGEEGGDVIEAASSGGREKEEEEEEEEENMEISSPNPSRDPSPAADFFSLGGEKEQGDVSSRVLLPTRMRRSRRRFPTFLVALDEEKTAMKKSSPHVVLLIRGAVPRFFGRRHLR
ncbi:hypothetical protein GW17_00060756 [Ensete ventricosum]|nr:hypothetical protein GW17_00060756 [Ensete ventricosum]